MSKLSIPVPEVSSKFNLFRLVGRIHNQVKICEIAARKTVRVVDAISNL